MERRERRRGDGGGEIRGQAEMFEREKEDAIKNCLLSSAVEEV